MRIKFRSWIEGMYIGLFVAAIVILAQIFAIVIELMIPNFENARLIGLFCTLAFIMLILIIIETKYRVHT